MKINKIIQNVAKVSRQTIAVCMILAGLSGFAQVGVGTAGPATTLDIVGSGASGTSNNTGGALASADG
ncbi:MAG: hypothetical protein GKR88_04945 [Flavobacteriaceae bacterium]|nr:MAG: hypothetical protein GKR88_04945 [Flavobacteriaceae bacterium]